MLRTPAPKEQAKLLAQLMKSHGANLAHQAALDVIAKLQGHRDWNAYSAALASSAQPCAAVSIAAAPKAPAGLSVGGFNVADLLTVRPDLSAELAEEVLHYCDRNFDASVGMNWEVLEALSLQAQRPFGLDALLVFENERSVPVFIDLHTGTLYLGGYAEVQDRFSTDLGSLSLRKVRCQLPLPAGTKVVVAFPSGNEHIDMSDSLELFEGNPEELQSLAIQARAEGMKLLQLTP